MLFLARISSLTRITYSVCFHICSCRKQTSKSTNNDYLPNRILGHTGHEQLDVQEVVIGALPFASTFQTGSTARANGSSWETRFNSSQSHREMVNYGIDRSGILGKWYLFNPERLQDWRFVGGIWLQMVPSSAEERRREGFYEGEAFEWKTSPTSNTSGKE